jgi:hypothetical protein
LSPPASNAVMETAEYDRGGAEAIAVALVRV